MERDSSSTSMCPECGSTSFTADPEGVPICEYCRTAYAPRKCACYRCGSAYGPGADRCRSCGAELTRECPACGARIPLLTRQCLVCGQALPAVDDMLARLTRSTHDQLRRVRQAGATIKAQEEVASKARLAEMWAEEERRHEELARARVERASQERLTVALALGVGAIVVVIAIAVAIVATSGAPVSLP